MENYKVLFFLVLSLFVLNSIAIPQIEKIEKEFEIGIEEAIIKQQFDLFCKEHAHLCSTPSQLSGLSNYQIFRENYLFVEKINKKANGKLKLKLGKFALMTREQFKKKMLQTPSPPPPLPQEKFHEPIDLQSLDLPEAFSWVEKGAVTSVKDQGTVGTCWAFSTVGNIEGQWKLAGHPLTSFSEEQLVECDGLDCSLFGGYPHLAMTYIIENGGLMTEAEYPYCCGNGDCYPCMPKGYNATFCGPKPYFCNKTCTYRNLTSNAHIKSWIAISNQSEQIQASLYKIGPLSILMNAEFLQFYGSGVWDPWWFSCDPKSLDHAVLIVGWGVQKGVFEDTPYWLVKNSWGKDWGDLGGYFKILRGKGTCGINTHVTVSVV